MLTSGKDQMVTSKPFPFVTATLSTLTVGQRDSSSSACSGMCDPSQVTCPLWASISLLQSGDNLCVQSCDVQRGQAARPLLFFSTPHALLFGVCPPLHMEPTLLGKMI